MGLVARLTARMSKRDLLGLAGILFVLVAPVNGWVNGDACSGIDLVPFALT